MNSKKQELGQYYTTNVDYILQGFAHYIRNKQVCDPFAGKGDLLIWASRYTNSVKGFDIEVLDPPSLYFIHKNDSIKNPKKYEFVLTNPPYRYTKKTDLYIEAIKSIMDSEEGILILPLNFFSASNSTEIRHIFFNKFEVETVNVFLHQVFEDTSYTVCSFYYKKRNKPIDKCLIEPMTLINFRFFNKVIVCSKVLEIHREGDWQVGGTFLKGIEQLSNSLRIFRLTMKDIQDNKGSIWIKGAYTHTKIKANFYVSESFAKRIKENIILARVIDTGTKGGNIALEDIRDYNIEALVGKESSRNQAFLIFKEGISIETQEKLITLFNEKFNKFREETASLGLTNFRDNFRKRVSFTFLYKFLNYLYYCSDILTIP